MFCTDDLEKSISFLKIQFIWKQLCRFLKNCGMEFLDEEIDRAVGLLWTNSFACAQGGGQVGRF